ncbi:MAG: hypothetical protein PUI16_02685 [Clostridia bacterium]|nr:hypothetical protein [Clostridia bacterium]MDY5555666.1 hypothetical protein [Blautia sp.]
MTVKTEFGDFGSFKDLQTFMRLENKSDVTISSCDWWGIECILHKSGFTFTKNEIDQIVGLNY